MTWSGVLQRARSEPFPFEVVADLDRQISHGYDRTTAYLIDKRGVVRQVFPMLIHFRPSWKAVLGEVEKLARQDTDGE